MALNGAARFRDHIVLSPGNPVGRSRQAREREACPVPNNDSDQDGDGQGRYILAAFDQTLGPG
jgi:hypothetical protein